MDVARTARPFRLRVALLIAGLHLAAGGFAHADPMYTAIDLGTGSLTYGVDSSGNGTVTGSSGQTYLFNAAKNYLPSQWANTSVGVPLVQQAPIWDPEAYGNPLFAFSFSLLKMMNSQGLAAGINPYGVNGHEGFTEAFITQQQPNGSWGPPTALWAGTENFGGWGTNVGIDGISANGQVLGYGVASPSSSLTQLFLYDPGTHTRTNLTTLINSILRPTDQGPYWLINTTQAQIDDQGRLLVQASPGPWGTPQHSFLLIPDNLPNQVPAPEPAAWAAFALLMGGLVAHGRLRARQGR